MYQDYPWYLNVDGNSYANGEVTCPAGSVLISSGAYCMNHGGSPPKLYAIINGTAGCESDGTGNAASGENGIQMLGQCAWQ